MLLLIPSALAYTIAAPGDIICMETQATSPENGAVDVALDHAPAALLSGGCSNQPVRVELWSGDELVAEADEKVQLEGLIELFPELQPDTTYRFLVTPEGASETVVEFTTGDRETQDLNGEPDLIRVDVDHDRPDWIGVQAEVDLIPDPEGAFFVELVDEDGALWALSSHEQGGVDQIHSSQLGEKPDEVCLTALQRQADGTRVASASVCDARTGCSAAGLGASLVPALLALGALRRRRRA